MKTFKHEYNMYTFTCWLEYSFIFHVCAFDGCCDSRGLSLFYFSLEWSIVNLQCVLCFFFEIS